METQNLPVTNFPENQCAHCSGALEGGGAVKAFVALARKFVCVKKTEVSRNAASTTIKKQTVTRILLTGKASESFCSKCQVLLRRNEFVMLQHGLVYLALLGTLAWLYVWYSPGFILDLLNSGSGLNLFFRIILLPVWLFGLIIHYLILAAGVASAIAVPGLIAVWLVLWFVYFLNHSSLKPNWAKCVAELPEVPFQPLDKISAEDYFKASPVVDKSAIPNPVLKPRTATQYSAETVYYKLRKDNYASFNVTDVEATKWATYKRTGKILKPLSYLGPMISIAVVSGLVYLLIHLGQLYGDKGAALMHFFK